jgi:murein DD-endopeptidase MepM/ murein hydrolase activator NlpD
MNGLVAFTEYQAEALMICLAASIVWAGFLFVGARRIERAGAMTSAEKLWAAALLFAVLPSLIAPTLAAFGVSLRSAPEPIVVEAIATPNLAAHLKLESAVAAPTAAPIDAEQVLGAAAIIYVYGVFLTFFLWAARNLALHYAIARAERIDDEEILARIDEWADRLEVRRPEIRRSRHVSSVCIFGVIRQTILIPDGIEMRVSSDDLILMCAHELAHVRRGDTRLFTATQLARVLFWFNPMVARIAARAELAAEERADALVLSRGVDRRRYAACFVEGLKFAASRMNAQPALAPSFTPHDRHGRRRRLNSILAPGEERHARLSTRLMLSAAASTIALIAVGQAALAVDPASAKERRRMIEVSPLAGEITSAFAEKSVRKDGSEGPAHDGVDIKAKKGAKIFAPGDGVVVEATDLYDRKPSYGKVVVIDHGHGLVTRYAHLDSYSVRRGDRVKAGDVFATVGATGNVSGPHLHFETLKDGAPVDPAAVIAASPEAVDPSEPADPAAPIIAPEPAPEPSAAPSPAEAPVPAIAPVPRPERQAAHVLGFSFRLAPPKNGFPEFKIINPVVTARAPLIDNNGIHFTEPTGFAFADGDFAGDLMADDIEERLLGAVDDENGAVYDLTLRSGDKVYRFSSDEPMSAEKRAELRAALEEMKRERARAMREVERADAERERARAEISRRQEEWRREAERARREAMRIAEESRAYEFAQQAADYTAARAEMLSAQREALESDLEAIDEAHNGLDEAMEDGVADALADLDDSEADLAEQELSREDLQTAQQSIDEARRQLERDGEHHKREIENARRDLERQRQRIELEIEKIDDELADEG